MSKSYLFVVAHPDDEILGAGATICRLADNGHRVAVCCLSSLCDTRYDDLVAVCKKTHEMLGIQKSYIGRYTSLMLNTVNHLELVQFIEDAIMDCKADILITHHPHDSNIDHGVTAEACFEAARLPQRAIGYSHIISNIMTMEVPSETDWQLNNTVSRFVPNTYYEISESQLQRKCNAIDLYDNVLRHAPHPRSQRNLNALASIRGSESGFMLAEAFHSLFRIEGD